MESERFDRLAMSLSGPPTRRAALGLAAALGLGGVLGAGARKRKKKKCKSCTVCQRCKKGKCKPKPNGAACGPGTCQAGVCQCPTECCSNADCGAGAECLANGSCATSCTGETCPQDCGCSFPTVEGPRHCTSLVFLDCMVLQECTSTAQCPAGQQCQESTCPGNPTLCFPLCPA